MTTALFTHSECLGHVTPPGHPERVERLEAITAALGDATFDALDRREAPVAERADLLRAHGEAHVASIEAAAQNADGVALDADTFVMAGSMSAALRAVGANIAAVDAVIAGEVANAFCAIRPPGHHAERSHAMGFCLFNNIAISAKRALDHHGLSRVAIVDFDVHHGNGTQDILWDESRVLFASTHQMPLYPGSGAAHETGAHGNVMNVPLPPGAGSMQFRQAMERQVLPALDDFRPELLLISAGFDAHGDDPLAQLELREEDFAWVTGQLCDLAQTHCGGRVVSTLEGGYDLQALAASVAAHVTVLMERGR
ncbi:histone deacetylase family protein [Tropicimonas isoalkanivorans]|uniref:Acetoin utilization deacetylase AcuC n=1 Tax=Tropicimonas isoalkanivorans TaxID=441112 RepID=A0A1I1LW68_9RHOB|nr:histone deacetylase family protein [Tropicimonas isoalkanivorans]SFC77146.1 Acetoin utilization deacetylase AcuC [Tropicimonas isoalkanivorans]